MIASLPKTPIVNPCTPVVTLSGLAERWWGQKSWQVMDRVPQWHMRPSPTPSCLSRLLPCAWYASRCRCTALWPRWVCHWKCCQMPTRSLYSYSSHFSIMKWQNWFQVWLHFPFFPSPLSPNMLRVPSMSVCRELTLLWQQHSVATLVLVRMSHLSLCPQFPFTCSCLKWRFKRS